jgi:iron complex outermembrane receptor protein
MKKHFLWPILAMIGVALALGGSPAVYAQEDDKETFTLDEITVTAERRETNAMETPVAVTAFNTEDLDDLGVEGSYDLMMRLPSVTIDDDNKVTIRGVGREINQLGTEPGVAFYQDGIYNTQTDAILDTFDSERIEVLRGPQSTLFGMQSIGGAVNVQIKKPQLGEFGGQVKVKLGNYEERDFSAAVNVPLYRDKLAMRLTANHNHDGGYTKNVVDNSYARESDDWWARLQLRWQPTDRLDILARAQMNDNYATIGGLWYFPDPYDHSAEYDPAFPWVKNTNFGGPSNPSLCDGCEWHSIWNPRNTGNHKHNVMEGDGDSVTTHITFDLTDTWTIKHGQEYRTWDWSYAQNNDFFDDNHTWIEIVMHVRGFQEELQFLYASPDSPIQAIFGLNYYKMHQTQEFRMLNHGEPFYNDPVIIMPGFEAFVWTGDFVPVYRGDTKGGTMLGFDAWNEDSNKAVYGQIDYQFADRWNLTLGLRYTVDDKKGWESQRFVLPADLIIPGATQWYMDIVAPGVYTMGIPFNFYEERSPKNSWDEFVGTAGLDYMPTDDALLFAKFTKGYKGGGQAMGSFQDPVDPETLYAYETGWKQKWLDGRYNSVLGAYYYDYRDMQVARDIWNADKQVSLATMENAEGANNWGIELETQGYVIDNLLVTFTYSFIHAEYSEFRAIDATFPSNGDPTKAGEQDLEGNRLNRTPEHKFAVSGLYTLPTEIGDFSLYLFYHWMDEMYYRPFNLEYGKGAAYGRLDGRLMWHSTDRKWRVAFAVDNITNEPGVVKVNVEDVEPNPTRNYVLIPPLRYALEVSWHF